ncbi:MAG: radical SAM protein [Lachnospiraceae bacterium]|nr:radical SAM protein [Lachnospiraceae bacterium]
MTEMVRNDGYIMQMQNFSVNDGDGIRTTIFMCGCPLSCIWCCNPENAYHSDAEIPHHTGQAALKAHHMTLDEVDQKISRQALFYRGNGGGITFSGGEATVQQGFLRAMVNRFYDKGYDLSLETCGVFSFDEMKDILQKMNLIFMDLKLFDDSLHRFFTGASNDVILENIRQTALLPAPVVVRIPVIVGVNAFDENIDATCAFLEDVQASGPASVSLELLPYHRYGMDKYAALGIPDPDVRYERLKKQEKMFSFAERMEIPSEELLEKYREIAAAHQIRIVSYR